MANVISADGTSIGYETHGSGPTLILVAGATQYRAVDNAGPKLASLLADAFTVVIYDRRGRGESGNTRPYAVTREIEDIEALIDAVGAPAFLVGGSSGAVLAIEAAAALPRKIAKVIAYEPPFDPAQSAEEGWAALAEQEAFAEENDGDRAMVRFMASVGMPQAELDGFRASPGWPAFAAVGHTIAHDFRVITEARHGGGMETRWGGVSQPVLIADGDASFAFMAAGAEMAVKALPNVRRKTLAGQGHGPAPEAFAPVIREFFT
jgi:pimeloyl-ACP methyl ester carboxylesterase